MECNCALESLIFFNAASTNALAKQLTEKQGDKAWRRGGVEAGRRKAGEAGRRRWTV